MPIHSPYDVQSTHDFRLHRRKEIPAKLTEKLRQQNKQPLIQFCLVNNYKVTQCVQKDAKYLEKEIRWFPNEQHIYVATHTAR